MPHWGSINFKNMYLKNRIEIAYKENQVPLILLTDNQYIIVEENNFKIIDVKENK